MLRVIHAQHFLWIANFLTAQLSLKFKKGIPMTDDQLLDTPAKRYRAEVERKRQECLAKIAKIPVAALIWGPNPDAGTDVAKTRLELRAALIKKGHVAHFSEELYDTECPYSNLTQQATQAEAYDVVFSVPDSPGSVAEIHDFARLPAISNKVIAFLNSSWNNGYANRSLIESQTISTCKIQLYDASGLPECVVKTALDIVVRMQELFYLQGRREY